MSVLVILPRVAELTTNYHSGGGVAVVATTENEALAMLRAVDRRTEMQIECYGDPTDLGYDETDRYAKPVYVVVDEAEWSKRRVFHLRGKHKPEVFVFPDKGCC